MIDKAAPVSTSMLELLPLTVDFVQLELVFTAALCRFLAFMVCLRLVLEFFLLGVLFTAFELRHTGAM